MTFSFPPDPKEEQKEEIFHKKESIQHTSAPLHDPLDYTSEGSEFLDDALRMKEQPLLFTGFRTELTERTEEK